MSDPSEKRAREIRSLCLELLRLAKSHLKILRPGDPAWREVKKIEEACNEFSGAVVAYCERRNAWVIAARDLISAKIAGSAEEAERMLADWETESRIVREHSETSGGSGGRPKGARYRVRKPTPGL